MHWTCATVSFPACTITYNDSHSSSSFAYSVDLLHHILAYLQDKHLRAFRRPDETPWRLIGSNIYTTPQQRKGFDCSIHLCLVADSHMRRTAPTYTTAQAASACPYLGLALLWQQPLPWT